MAGGEGWRRVDDFDLSWANPDQGPASPIGGAYWRITGPAGYDTGVKLAPARASPRSSTASCPAPGLYTFHLWLRDEAGNDNPASALDVPLRFDDVPPGVAFAVSEGGEIPDQIRAEVSDAPLRSRRGVDLLPPPRRRAAGSSCRPGSSPAPTPGKATLVARTPDLAPGTYVFRADAVDAAGNTATTTLRADGTEMAIRKRRPRWRRAGRRPRPSPPHRARRHACSRGCGAVTAAATR